MGRLIVFMWLVFVGTAITQPAITPHIRETEDVQQRPAPPVVDATVTGETGDWITIKAKLPNNPDGDLLWTLTDKKLKMFPQSLLRDPSVILVSSKYPGTYYGSVSTAKSYTTVGKSVPKWKRKPNVDLKIDDKDLKVTDVDISVDVEVTSKALISFPSVVQVIITGDVGPGPTPKPIDPPIPVPVDPAPIPGEGFRVLIVYESAERLSSGQAVALRAKSLFDYLNSKCAQGPSNKDWRIWDKDVDLSGESALWQNAMKRPRKSLPWIIISDGKTGFEGPLPPDIDSTLALLKKYGGN